MNAGKTPSLAAIVGMGLVVGQLAGCGSCVKEDDPQTTTATDPNAVPPRKPINLRAADRRLSQYSDANLEPDAAPDAPTD